MGRHRTQHVSKGGIDHGEHPDQEVGQGPVVLGKKIQSALVHNKGVSGQVLFPGLPMVVNDLGQRMEHHLPAGSYHAITPVRIFKVDDNVFVETSNLAD
ncbi:MAG: hypothetical protein ACYTBV_10660, partial [Planctomycetota bacterium]